MQLLKEFGLKVQEDNEKKIGKLPEKREKPCEIQSVIPFKVHWLAVPKKFREVVEIWTCCAEFFFVKFSLIYRWRLFRIVESVMKLNGEEMTETFLCLQNFQSRKLDRDIVFFLKKGKLFSARFWIS